jgi:glycosyltransferase involved in cell wall biosynthesis
MLVTVAICTWNRARQLDRTLESLKNVIIPSGYDIDIIIINNNCTDCTDEVIDRHQSGLPIRRVFEPELGISHARNASVVAALGKLIIFTDDDVILDPDWITEYIRAARESPESSFFAGPIEPRFEGKPPRWLTADVRRMSGPYGWCRYAETDRPLHPHEYPFAGNLAVRTDAIKNYIFEPQLGHVGGRLLNGEETDLIIRMKRDGHLGMWVADAKVVHMIPPEKQKVAYLYRWFVGYGRTVVRMDEKYFREILESSSRAELRAHWAVRLRVLINQVPIPPRPRWLALLLRAAYASGLFSEALRLMSIESQTRVGRATSL